MPSSKKKRGQRREGKRRSNATPKRAAVSSTGGGGGSARDANRADGVSDFEFVSTLDVDVVVAGVARGDDATTAEAWRFVNILTNFEVVYGSVIEGGLVPILRTVLSFLGRCADEDFDAVLADVGGDLRTPAVWIGILVELCNIEHECDIHLKIAEGIRTLAECMSDSETRRLFRSKKHWHMSKFLFIQLIHDLLLSRKVTEVLLRYEGVLEAIIQWTFWQSLRPDIMEESRAYTYPPKIHTSSNMSVTGLEATQLLIAQSATMSSGSDLAMTIGSMPIVSRVYDPECKEPFVVKFIRCFAAGKTLDETASATIAYLVGHGDCVDKCVISEVMDLAQNRTSPENFSCFAQIPPDIFSCFARILFGVVTKPIPNGGIRNRFANDTRCAAAIRRGLLDICMNYINHFGYLQEKSCGPMNYLLHAIHSVCLDKKSSRAIGSWIGQRHSSISKELHCLRENKSVTEKWKKMLDKVQSIIELNYVSCFRCGDPVERSAQRFCGGCRLACYCSEKCQAEDWHNGHKEHCERRALKESTRVFSGATHGIFCSNESTKTNDLVINIVMVQEKMFLNHRETILRQLNSKNLAVMDGVVRFDLRCCPPSVDTVPCTDLLENDSDDAMKEWFEDHRSAEHITCVYSSTIRNGEMDEDGNCPTITLLRSFEFEALLDGPQH